MQSTAVVQSLRNGGGGRRGAGLPWARAIAERLATVDLLALRSDAYRVTDDHRLELVPERGGRPPLVDLDPAHYKIISDFEIYFPVVAPSLVRCDSLKVTGRLRFEPGVVCEGTVEFASRGTSLATVPAGIYKDVRREF